ncbi:hypothetical protein TNCT_323931 [Trichonephila clavata]|uniref:Uncharacterized protein n=1 Tax=Trichonephila clavata TaxID=2740835 RepID=A0A8X6G287_TRICU|nr:hypothetical protein TNCT_323931 [Trichonephila clavata]
MRPRRSVFSPQWEVWPGFSCGVRFRLRTSGATNQHRYQVVGICGSSRNGQVVSLMQKEQCSISNLSAVKKKCNALMQFKSSVKRFIRKEIP